MDNFSQLHPKLRELVVEKIPKEMVDDKMMSLLLEISNHYQRLDEELAQTKQLMKDKLEEVRAEMKTHDSDKKQQGELVAELQAVLSVLEDSSVDQPIQVEDPAFLARKIAEKVAERNQTEVQLASRTEEMEILNKVMIGRELKMIELKKKVTLLEKEVKELTANQGKNKQQNTNNKE